MIVYRAYARGDYRDTMVTVTRDDGPETPLKHHVRHSPSGFAWGYGGSGPSDLARCILIDYLRLHDKVERDRDQPIETPEGASVSYQDFKAEVIAAFRWNGPVDEPAWTLTGEHIDGWLARHTGAMV